MAVSVNGACFKNQRLLFYWIIKQPRLQTCSNLRLDHIHIWTRTSTQGKAMSGWDILRNFFKCLSIYSKILNLRVLKCCFFLYIVKDWTKLRPILLCFRWMVPDPAKCSPLIINFSRGRSQQLPFNNHVESLDRLEWQTRVC